MTRHLFWQALILACLVCPGAQAQQSQPGSVQGRISNAQTGAPIAGASIQLFLIGRGAGKNPSTTSQADGIFRFEDVPPGTYSVVALHPGFGHAYAPHDQFVEVQPGQNVFDVNVVLNQLSILEGRVMDADGNPVAKSRVQAFSTFNRLGKMGLRHAADTRTDDKGHYLLKNLEPGRYFVSAEPAAVAEKKDDSGKGGLAQVRTFFPKSLDVESATPLEVAAGQNLAGTDITLGVGATVHVRGKVAALELASGQGATVSLASRNTSDTEALGYVAKVKSDTTFDIERVLPGSYTLWLSGNYGQGSAQRGNRLWLLCRQDLDVGNTDVDGVVLTLIPPVNLTGRITVEGINNPVFAQMRVLFTPTGEVAFGRFVNAAVTTDGVFEVKDLDPGYYSIRVANIPGGSYVKSILWNRQDVTTSGIDTSQGGSGALEVTLRKGTGEVAGTVHDGSVFRTILLVSENPSADGSGIVHGSAQADGAFLIPNVPPGRYYAYALQRWSTLWQTADLLRELQRLGTRIDVPEGGSIQAEPSPVTPDQLQQAAALLGLTLQ